MLSQQSLQLNFIPGNVIVPQCKCFSNLLTKIRDTNTGLADFRHYSKRLMRVLCEEALANTSQSFQVLTPTQSLFNGTNILEENVVAISIIRAGDSMLDTFLEIVPTAIVGKILIQRNELTAEPIFYYHKFPTLEYMKIFLLDPMLATGGSSICAIKLLVEKGANPTNITFITVVSCPEGINKVHEAYPDVTIVTASVDDGLNEKKYIVPGLGDFGDRFFGTL